LEAAVAELLAGSVGALAASHGGSIALVSVVDHTVTVRMSGACDGCPGASTTLRDVLERELRRRVDQQVVVVSSETDSATLSFGKKLLSLIVR
jgi:Fe-S cluster biogenesis protein NfuA